MKKAILIIILMFTVVSVYAVENSVLNQLTSALLESDYQSVSNMISDDGAVMSLNQSRKQVYTPGQAFYLLKTVLGQRDTQDVSTVRIKYNKKKDKLNAVLLWKYKIAKKECTETLFVHAVELEDGWKIVELQGGR